MLKALIFDVDGTLAETEEAHRQAFNETFAAAGLHWHWPQIRYQELLRVTGGKERMLHFAREEQFVLPTDGAAMIAQLHHSKTQRYTALVAAGGIALRPGVAELIVGARKSGLKLAVATTTSLPNVEALVKAAFGCSVASLFDVVSAGDSVKAKKPAPDVYLQALDALGMAARETIAFEDSTVGLRSAMSAGIGTIITPSLYTSADRFDGALRVFPNLLHGASAVQQVREIHERGCAARAKLEKIS